MDNAPSIVDREEKATAITMCSNSRSICTAPNRFPVVFENNTTNVFCLHYTGMWATRRPP